MVIPSHLNHLCADSPYMGPDKVRRKVNIQTFFFQNLSQGMRNDPSTVVRGVAAIAQVKGLPEDEMRRIIRTNFNTLFNL